MMMILDGLAYTLCMLSIIGAWNMNHPFYDNDQFAFMRRNVWRSYLMGFMIHIWTIAQ